MSAGLEEWLSTTEPGLSVNSLFFFSSHAPLTSRLLRAVCRVMIADNDDNQPLPAIDKRLSLKQCGILANEVAIDLETAKAPISQKNSKIRTKNF